MEGSMAFPVGHCNSPWQKERRVLCRRQVDRNGNVSLTPTAAFACTVHLSYGSLLGAADACSSSDCRYLMQPCMNSGQSGTTETGSVFSGKSPHSAGWCQ